MQQTGSLNDRVQRLRVIVLVLFAILTGTVFVSTRTPATVAANLIEPQQGARPMRRMRAQASRAPARDLSKFSHATEGHKENCASCHKIPLVAFDKSDIRDYPDHDACLQCHRQRYAPIFFKGARPVICTICHKVVSPRSDARFEFPKANVASQFTDIFPHNKHFKSTSLPMFKRIIEAEREASGAKAETTKAKFNAQDSCIHCHKIDKTEVKPPAGAPEGAFVPKPGTFMTTPSNHPTCFACHWKEGVDGRDVKPLANDCNECHKNIATPLNKNAVAVKTAHAVKFIPTIAISMPPVPMATPLPPRISPKFVHELDAHLKKTDENNKEVAITCIQCHTAIKKVATLEDLRSKQNKVQITTCATSACHSAVSGSAALKLSVLRELRLKSKDEKFDCAFCHLPNISTDPMVPCDHYTVVYATAVAEKKDTKGIEALVPARCTNEVKSGKQ